VHVQCTIMKDLVLHTSTALRTSFSVLHCPTPSKTVPAISSMHFSRDRVYILQYVFAVLNADRLTHPLIELYDASTKSPSRVLVISGEAFVCLAQMINEGNTYFDP